MKLFYGDYCTSSQVTIDDVDVTDLMADEKYSEAMPLYKSAIIKWVESTDDIAELDNIFRYLMTNVGEYKDLGNCEQCGGYNEEYTLEV